MSKKQKALLVSFLLGILGWNLFALRQYLEERGEFLARPAAFLIILGAPGVLHIILGCILRFFRNRGSGERSSEGVS